MHLFLAIALAAAPAPAKKLKFVVHELATQGGIPPDNGATLSLQVCQELAALGDYDVICTDELRAMAEMQQTQASTECVQSSDDCLKMIGELSQADRLVTGSVGKLDKSTVLESQLARRRERQSFARASDKVNGGVDAVLERIKPTLEKAPHAEQSVSADTSGAKPSAARSRRLRDQPLAKMEHQNEDSRFPRHFLGGRRSRWRSILRFVDRRQARAARLP